MATTIATVAEYIAAAAPERRPELERLRALVRRTVPAAAESVRHGMPFYEHHGVLCAFAAQKHHFSFYLLDGELVARHRGLLAGLDVGKGCIRYRRPEQLPDATIRTLLAAAAASNQASPNDHC
jgi:uncharacterized protein YdhG (YjbR/CyaY superfamily)